jgi:hypothetical protein
MVSQSRPYLYAHRTAQKRQPPERLANPVLRVDVQGSNLLGDDLSQASKRPSASR